MKKLLLLLSLIIVFSCYADEVKIRTNEDDKLMEIKGKRSPARLPQVTIRLCQYATRRISFNRWGNHMGKRLFGKANVIKVQESRLSPLQNIPFVSRRLHKAIDDVNRLLHAQLR